MKPSGNPTWNPGDAITDTKLNAIENALKGLENVAVLPAAGSKGRMVILTSDNKIYYDNGTAWRIMGEDSRIIALAIALA